MRKLFIVTLIYLLQCNHRVWAINLQDSWINILQAMHNVEGFNGAVLVSQHGNILLEKGYGFRNV